MTEDEAIQFFFRHPRGPFPPEVLEHIDPEELKRRRSHERTPIEMEIERLKALPELPKCSCSARSHRTDSESPDESPAGPD